METLYEVESGKIPLISPDQEGRAVLVMVMMVMDLQRQHGGADRARVLGSDELDTASALLLTSCMTLTSHTTFLDFSFLSL